MVSGPGSGAGSPGGASGPRSSAVPLDPSTEDGGTERVSVEAVGGVSGRTGLRTQARIWRRVGPWLGRRIPWTLGTAATVAFFSPAERLANSNRTGVARAEVLS